MPWWANMTLTWDPSQPFAPAAMPVDRATLERRFAELFGVAQKASLENSRLGHLATVEKRSAAALVAEAIGGVDGADRRAHVEQIIAQSHRRLGDMAAASRAAC